MAEEQDNKKVYAGGRSEPLQGIYALVRILYTFGKVQHRYFPIRRR
ncbi:MAG: hypothetical protein SCH71_04755 [Desulfobulbaceae bacterium]|nr:hypothetical protein [Desulfobulbaceae bacterium]